MKLLNLSLQRKKAYKKAQADDLKRRVLTGKNVKLTPEEKDTARRETHEERVKFEEENISERFMLIYPNGKTDQSYQQFLDKAQDMWEQFTTGKKYEKRKEEDKKKEKKNLARMRKLGLIK